MTLFSVDARLNLDTGEFDRGIDQARNSGQSLGSSLAKVGAAIGAVMVGIGAASLNAGLNFERSLGGIQAQTGQTTADIQRTGNAVRDLALEQGRFTAQEMIAGLESVSRHGQTTEQQMDMLRSAMRLSMATGTSFGSSISYLDQLMVKFGKETLDGATQFTNMFATAQGVAGVAMSSLTDGLQRAAGITQVAGLEYDFVAAALTRAYQGGMSMQVAATALSGIFGDMLDPTSNIRQTMDDLGIALVRNADGSVDATASMDNLMDSLRGMDPVAQEAAFSMLNLNGNALTFFTTLKNEGHYVDELSQAFRDGIEAGDEYWRVMEMIESRTIGIADSFGLLRNQGNEVLKTIFDIISAPLAEMLQRAAYSVGNLVSRLREGGDLHPQMVALGNALARLGDAIFGLVDALLPVIVTWLPKLATALSAVMNFVAPLAPLILGVYAAFKTWKVTMAISNLVKGLGKAVWTMGANFSTAGLAIGATTKKVGILKKAKLLLNKAFKANPLGLFLVAATAVIAIGGALIRFFRNLFSATNRVSEETQALAQRTEELADRQASFADRTEAAAAALADYRRGIAQSADTARNLANSIFSMANETDRSSGSLARQQGLIEELNAIMPGLNLAMDEYGNIVGASAEMVDKLIEAERQRSEVQALIAESIRLYQEESEKIANQAEVAAELAEAQRRLSEGYYQNATDRRALIAQIEILQGIYDDYTELLGENAEAQYELNGAIEEAAEALAYTEEALESYMETAVEVFGEVGAAASAANAIIQGATAEQRYALATLADRYVELESKATDALNRMNDTTTHTFESMIETLQHNARVMREWGDNQAAVMERAAELTAQGVEAHIIQDFIRMADECPALAAMMAQGTIEQWMELADAASDASNSVVDNMSTGLGEHEDVILAARQLAQEGVEETLRDQLEAADFPAMGQGVAQGFGDGILSGMNYPVDSSREMAVGTYEAAASYLQSSSPSMKFMSLGQGVAQGLANGIQAMTGTAVAAATALAQAVERASRGALRANSPSQIFKSIGQGVVTGLTSGINATASQAIDSVTNMHNTMVDDFSKLPNDTDNAIRDLPNVFQRIFEKITRSIQQWTTSKKSDTQSVLQRFVQMINQTMSPLPGQMQNIAVQMMNGFQVGLNANMNSIMNQVRNFANNVAATMRAALQVRSPSRVFIDIAKNVAEGFIVGLDNMADRVSKAVVDTFGKFDGYDIALAPQLAYAGVAPNAQSTVSQQAPIIIENKQVFYVRDEYDIDMIGRELDRANQRAFRSLGY